MNSNSQIRHKRSEKWKKFIEENILMILTVLAVFTGIAIGFVLKFGTGKEIWSDRELMYIQFPGTIFLRMLKSLILPLIISSIVSAIGNLDLSLSGANHFLLLT